MMLDWLTLHVPTTALDDSEVLKLRGMFGRILKIAPGGELEWEAPSREVIRSDSHQVTVELGSKLRIHGSPARVMYTHNVFGSSDIIECAQAMISHVARTLDVRLPGYRRWGVSRTDITKNYDLGSLTAVKEALAAFRHVEGGRFKYGNRGDTHYWNQHSRRKASKAYGKGPHMRYLVKKGFAECSDDELDLCDRLLRMELKLGPAYWSDALKVFGLNWFDYKAADFARLHYEYFEPLIGSAEITEMTDVRSRIIEVGASLGYTEGTSLGAYKHYCHMMAVGYHRAREDAPRSSFYRHMKIIKAAGISWADIQARKILPFRRKPILLGEPVRSFDEMRRSA